MPGRFPIEFPNWIDGVLVQNAIDEQAHRNTLAASLDASGAPEPARDPFR
jgi:hypothetical protein